MSNAQINSIQFITIDFLFQTLLGWQFSHCFFIYLNKAFTKLREEQALFIVLKIDQLCQHIIIIRHNQSFQVLATLVKQFFNDVIFFLTQFNKWQIGVNGNHSILKFSLNAMIEWRFESTIIVAENFPLQATIDWQVLD